jgi:hypothetical protein
MYLEQIRHFDLKVTENARLTEWILKTKTVLPDSRIVIDPTRRQIIINYTKLTPGQQLIMDLMLVEIT